MVNSERIEKWLTVVAAIVRVLLIALAGATGDQLLAEGRVGEQLAEPLRVSLSKSSAAAPVALLQVRLPLA